MTNYVYILATILATIWFNLIHILFALAVVLIPVGTIFFLFKATWLIVLKKQPKFPSAGDNAPNFTLYDSEQNAISLSDFTGKDIVLYFYPQADTPGCTKEACLIRDSYKDFTDKNIIVLGVSYNTPEVQKAFKQKYHLPFILLSDTKKDVAKLYGAYTSKLNELFPNRMTFIIDKQQKIKEILYAIDIATHAQDVLSAVNKK